MKTSVVSMAGNLAH